MLGWVIRLLLIVLVVRLVWHALSALRPAPPPRQVPRPKGGALVRDPVCGTYVEPAHALSTRAGDAMIYFCSERCRHRYLTSA